MKVVMFGLSITSSWGNGHATTFRALAKGLHARGHRIVFFEHNLEWYESNRDLPDPPFCELQVYEEWREVLPQVRRELANADVALVGSYFPDGISAAEEILQSRVTVKSFYDIDTPITVAKLRSGEESDYVRRDQIPGFDLYLSFTGGPLLREIETSFGARKAVPLYCSFDPDQYRSWPANKRFICDLSYMGTYASDRQPKLDELLCETARRLPEKRFIVAGPQYPRRLRWPENVRRIMHLNPRWHPQFYSSSRLTLNITRREMVRAGYSPSVRLFEAAACAAAIASDNWPGVEEFFAPGRDILLPTGAADVVRYINDYDNAELREIGRNAQARVLDEHTNRRRAEQFEAYVSQVNGRQRTASSAANNELIIATPVL